MLVEVVLDVELVVAVVVELAAFEVVVGQFPASYYHNCCRTCPSHLPVCRSYCRMAFDIKTKWVRVNKIFEILWIFFTGVAVPSPVFFYPSQLAATIRT